MWDSAILNGHGSKIAFANGLCRLLLLILVCGKKASVKSCQCRAVSKSKLDHFGASVLRSDLVIRYAVEIDEKEKLK